MYEPATLTVVPWAEPWKVMGAAKRGETHAGSCDETGQRQPERRGPGRIQHEQRHEGGFLLCPLCLYHHLRGPDLASCPSGRAAGEGRTTQIETEQLGVSDVPRNHP